MATSFARQFIKLFRDESLAEMQVSSSKLASAER